MKAASTFLVLLTLLCTNVFGQACFGVEIETKSLIILPECNDSSGSILFSNTSGGTPPYTFNFNGSSNQFGAFNNLTLGIYELIIADSRGCRDTFNINMRYKDLKEIIKPDNAFTPNGDDFNDTWYIPGIESFEGTEVLVFNRWGQKVLNNSQYGNDFGWDGTQNGLKLPSGTYFYMIEIINNCIDERITGTVTIIR
jgi:gliding motility-associated-like protein